MTTMNLTPLQQKMLESSLHELGLNVRTINALETHANVFTVKELLMKRPEQLLELPNFGHKTLETIYAALEKYGFYRQSKRKQTALGQDSEIRRNRIRTSLGGSALDNWDTEIIASKAGARKRKGRKPKSQ